MASPVASSYTVAAGQPIYAGKHRSGFPRGALLAGVSAGGYFGSNPSRVVAGATLGACSATGSLVGYVPPAWLAGAVIGQWVSIPAANAAALAGLNLDAYSGFAIKQATGEILVVAAGGHNDGADNGAASIVLTGDAPAWVRRKASTWNGSETNVLYYADGRPTSRHTYEYIHYIAGLNAVLLAGCRFGYGGGTPTGPGMDLFSLASNDYVARYTYPDISPWPAAGYAGGQDADGHLWTGAGYKFNVSTLTWSRPGTGTLHRYPYATNPSNNTIFSLQWGDGEGGADPGGYRAARLDCATGNSVAITINASAALTAFEAAAPSYMGMGFDPVAGVFLAYHGTGVENGKVYRITPNAGTAWNMDVLPTTGTPGTALSVGGIFGRFRYVSALRGFVLMQRQAEGLYFLRTS